MRRLAYFVLVPLMLLVLAVPMVSLPPTGPKGNSDNASALLVWKDHTTWEVMWTYNAYGTGNTFGEIKYKTTDIDEARLQLHGLKPNNWYLVTFEGPDDQWVPNEYTADEIGIFGAKSSDGWYWTDVALVKTNDYGDVNVVMPLTEATHAQVNYAPDFNPSPILGAGSYTNVHVSVKDVGYWADGPDGISGTADDGSPANWGSPSLLEPESVLFEYNVLSFAAA